jgi:hypothetical protein
LLTGSVLPEGGQSPARAGARRTGRGRIKIRRRRISHPRGLGHVVGRRGGCGRGVGGRGGVGVSPRRVAGVTGRVSGRQRRGQRGLDLRHGRGRVRPRPTAVARRALPPATEQSRCRRQRRQKNNLVHDHSLVSRLSVSSPLAEGPARGGSFQTLHGEGPGCGRRPIRARPPGSGVGTSSWRPRRRSGFPSGQSRS